MAGEFQQLARGTRDASESDDVLASEIAAYAYCAKAWHLEFVLEKRVDAAANEQRHAGRLQHDAHGHRVRRLERIGQPLLRVGVVLLVAAVALLIAALVLGRG